MSEGIANVKVMFFTMPRILCPSRRPLGFKPIRQFARQDTDIRIRSLRAIVKGCAPPGFPLGFS